MPSLAASLRRISTCPVLPREFTPKPPLNERLRDDREKPERGSARFFPQFRRGRSWHPQNGSEDLLLRYWRCWPDTRLRPAQVQTSFSNRPPARSSRRSTPAWHGIRLRSPS